jgi:hypothetical protein
MEAIRYSETASEHWCPARDSNREYPKCKKHYRWRHCARWLCCNWLSNGSFKMFSFKVSSIRSVRLAAWRREDAYVTCWSPIHLLRSTVNGFVSSFVTSGTCRFYNEGRWWRRKVHSREDESHERTVLPYCSSQWDIWMTKHNVNSIWQHFRTV